MYQTAGMETVTPSSRAANRFLHEGLDAFELGLEYNERIDMLLPGLRRRRSLQDQLDRASVSVLANIAEGAQEQLPREKARFFRYALRSAAECGALLKLAERRGIGDAKLLATCRQLLLRLCPVLMRIIQSQLRKARRQTSDAQ
jgi:four helix bundle protein